MDEATGVRHFTIDMEVRKPPHAVVCHLLSLAVAAVAVAAATCSSLSPPPTPAALLHCNNQQLAGQNETVMSLLTLPPDYLDSGRVSPLGVVLAHGADAEETWRGPLLERLAAQLALQVGCCVSAAGI